MKRINQIGIFCFIFIIVYCGTENSDQGGNSFKSVKIGEQVWMSENLNVSTFRNGEPIPEVKTNEDWEKAGTEGKPAWCHFENSTENAAKYGKLYNWYAVNDPRGLAPEGWHIPSEKEWQTLEMELGMTAEETEKLHQRGTDEGNKLKDIADSNWKLSDKDKTNCIGFSALTAGGRWGNGKFGFGGKSAFFWTSTETVSGGAWARGIHPLPFINRCDDGKGYGMSVRCIKD